MEDLKNLTLAHTDHGMTRLCQRVGIRPDEWKEHLKTVVRNGTPSNAELMDSRYEYKQHMRGIRYRGRTYIFSLEGSTAALVTVYPRDGWQWIFESVLEGR